MKKLFFTISLVVFGLAGFAQRITPPEQLAKVKADMYKFDNASTAYKTLIKDADKILDTELIPVTEKTIIAASGDKHDYISIGPYWWPDPSKPDGLPYIRKDGQRNPELEKLDKNKLDKMAKSVIKLGYAYFFSGDEKYAEKAVEFLNIWFLNKKTGMNPNMNYGQMIPGYDGGKGRAEGVLDTYIFVEMTDCITLLSKSKAMKTKDLEGIKSWFSQYLDWMLTSEVGQAECNAKNNHGIAFDVQATAYALFTGRQDIAGKLIKEFPENRLFKQIEPDGRQPLELERTIAFHYTLFNIEHIMDMCALAKSVEMDLFSAASSDGRSITKAIEFIKQYMGKPQSEFPYQQIKEWDLSQERGLWTLRRATFFQPNSGYDDLFDRYSRTKNTDIRWLLLAK
ncbi:MAG: alginate lyase family protein [Candidatus Azobacteroides sp.]|nr:alginate lyase family protein [Candidatus Azobacteroides sp.]